MNICGVTSNAVANPGEDSTSSRLLDLICVVSSCSWKFHNDVILQD